MKKISSLPKLSEANLSLLASKNRMHSILYFSKLNKTKDLPVIAEMLTVSLQCFSLGRFGYGELDSVHALLSY